MAKLTRNRWEASTQYSVDSILGAKIREVKVKGSEFYNVDRWTARTLWAQIVESIKVYGNALDEWTVRDAVRTANCTNVNDPHLVVASSPDRVPPWLMRASVGGAYHEAWHTEWSCRRDLSFTEVYEPLMERMSLLDDWAPYIGAVLHWSNIIEDIRIERLGCRKYPGSPAKMRDLQDLILKYEREGREAAGHKALGDDAMSVIVGTFRDIGLGYDSPAQRAALKGYKARSEAGYKLVTEGALKPLLDKAVALDADNDLGSFWLALEVVAILVEAGTASPPQEEGEGNTPGGEGGPTPPQQQEEKFAPNQGEQPEDGEGNTPPSKLPNVAIFKVGDRAHFKGKLVEITHAGLPDPVTGRQELQFAEVLG